MVVLPDGAEEIAAVIRVARSLDLPESCLAEPAPDSRAAHWPVRAASLSSPLACDAFWKWTPSIASLSSSRPRQPRSEPRGRTSRPLLRSRPIQSARLHHRWQRGGELRWAALPRLRRHHESRLGLELVLADGQIVSVGGWGRERPATISPACSSASRARSG